MPLIHCQDGSREWSNRVGDYSKLKILLFRRWSNCMGLKFLKVCLLRFFMKEDVSQNALSEIVGSLTFVAKFSKKENKFTNLVGDGMSKLRLIFHGWQGSIRLVWKQYCFGRICWSVEMLQWFAVLDFVLIFISDSNFSDVMELRNI